MTSISSKYWLLMGGQWTPFLESASVRLWFCQCLIPTESCSMRYLVSMRGECMGVQLLHHTELCDLPPVELCCLTGSSPAQPQGAVFIVSAVNGCLSVSQLGWKHFIKIATIHLKVNFSERMSLVPFVLDLMISLTVWTRVCLKIVTLFNTWATVYRGAILGL